MIRLVRIGVAAGIAGMMGGCIIPGVNEENADASARSTAQFGSVAPKRISPTQPTGISPTVVQLSWTSVSGAVSYEVYLGPDTNPPLLVRVNANSYVVRDLSECLTQYWRVVAIDADGAIVSSAIWSFTTRCP